MATTKTISRDGETRAIKITGKAGSTFEFYIKQRFEQFFMLRCHL